MLSRTVLQKHCDRRIENPTMQHFSYSRFLESLESACYQSIHTSTLEGLQASGISI